MQFFGTYEDFLKQDYTSWRDERKVIILLVQHIRNHTDIKHINIKCEYTSPDVMFYIICKHEKANFKFGFKDIDLYSMSLYALNLVKTRKKLINLINKTLEGVL